MSSPKRRQTGRRRTVRFQGALTAVNRQYGKTLSVLAESGAQSGHKRQRRATVSRGELELHERIVSNPAVCGGVPCIRGMRIPVKTVLSHLAAGERTEEILRNFPNLTEADIRACLEYASELAGVWDTRLLDAARRRRLASAAGRGYGMSLREFLRQRG